MARLYPGTISPDLISLNRKVEEELDNLEQEVSSISSATFVTAASGAPEISTTSLTIQTSLTEDVWTSVGPTNSGATVIWTAMDTLPDGTEWVDLRVRLFGTASGVTADDYVYSLLHAAKGGTTPTLGDCIVSQAADHTNSSGSGSGMCLTSVKVPLSSTKTINLRWANEGWTTNSIVVHLVGYGVNS